MNMINWNRLTPAVYAIYEAGGERGTTSDAANKVQRNVIDGADTCPGADALPHEFRPDWPRWAVWRPCRRATTPSTSGSAN